MGFWKKTLEQPEKKNEAPKPGAGKSDQPQPSAKAAAPAERPAPPPPAASSAQQPAPRPVEAPRPSEDRLNERFGKIRSALGPGTVIQGRLSFDTVVRIDGKLGGDIFSSKALIIGPTGRVDAQIEAAALVVLGTVSGKIKTAEKIEVWAGGKLEADIVTPAVIVEEGAFFAGNCKMTQPKANPPR